MTLQTAPSRPADPADDRPPSRQAVLVAVAAGLGYMFDAYVVDIYSFVLPLIAVTFAPSTTAQGVIGSIAFSTHSLALFVAAQVFGIGGLGWTWSVGETYVAELFPTRLRATGFGLGVSIGRIPAIAGPLVTGAMAAQIGIGNVARWFALIWVFLIIGYLIGPETRGRSLAKLDEIALRPHVARPPRRGSDRVCQTDTY